MGFLFFSGFFFRMELFLDSLRGNSTLTSSSTIRFETRGDEILRAY